MSAMQSHRDLIQEEFARQVEDRKYSSGDPRVHCVAKRTGCTSPRGGRGGPYRGLEDQAIAAVVLGRIERRIGALEQVLDALGEVPAGETS